MCFMWRDTCSLVKDYGSLCIWIQYPHQYNNNNNNNPIYNDEWESIKLKIPSFG